ncbi:MAG: hypothetical protein ABIG84_07850 [archaeon]
MYNFTDTVNNTAWNNTLYEPGDPPDYDSGTEFSGGAYTNITSSENSYAYNNYAGSAGGGYVSHNFRFHINESVSSIARLNISWEGYAAQLDNTNGFKKTQIRNQTGGDIDITDITTSDTTHMKEVNSSIGDYINSITGDISIRAAVYDDGPTYDAKIYTDFIQVIVFTGENFSVNHAPAVQTPHAYDNPALTAKIIFIRNDGMFINVSVTDAEGASDIDAVLITILNTTGGVIIDNATMIQDGSITEGYVYNYSWTVPDDAGLGTWTITVYANDSQNAWGGNTTTFEVDTPPPHLNLIQCEVNASDNWIECGNILYGSTLLGVRVNCTGISQITNATFRLENLPDSNIFFNVTNATSVSGDWWIHDNDDITIQDSGDWNLSASCIDQRSNQNSSSVNWSVPWGHLEPYLIDPVSDKSVARDRFFTFQSGVRCVGGECGDVNVTLDPEESKVYQILVSHWGSDDWGGELTLALNQTGINYNLSWYDNGVDDFTPITPSDYDLIIFQDPDTDGGITQAELENAIATTNTMFVFWSL